MRAIPVRLPSVLRGPHAARLLLVIAVAAPLVACGDESSGSARPAPPPVVVPDVPLADRAAFQVERLIRGPLPRTDRFPLPDPFTRNVTEALENLQAMREEALDLLSDPALIDAVARPERRNQGPWSNLLDALLAVAPVPVELATAWARPALEADDVQLRRRSVRLLAATTSPPGGDLLLGFLEASPTDREVPYTVLRAAIALGDPWERDAFQLYLREGAPLMWERLPGELSRYLGTMDEDRQPVRTRMADATAWWALLTELSGPREIAELGRAEGPAWAALRVLLHPAAWPPEAYALSERVELVEALVPVMDLDEPATLPGSLSASSVLPSYGLERTGRGVATSLRCLLASAGYEIYREAIAADLHSGDPLIEDRASQCAAVAVSPPNLEETEAAVASAIAALEAGRMPEGDLLGDLRRLRSAEEGRALPYMRRILLSARPYERHAQLLGEVYDVLDVMEPAETRRTVAEWVSQGDPPDVEAALHLIRRSRNPAYAPRLFDAARSAADPGPIRLLLIWLHAQPDAVGEDVLADFVEHIVAWIQAAEDEEALGYVSALPDLGEAGAAALKDGLRGPRRPLFVRALGTRRDIVAYDVAAALLEPLDATTPPAERHEVLRTVYRVAPAEAARLVAEARERLAPDDRSEVADVYQLVLHRAPGR